MLKNEEKNRQEGIEKDLIVVQLYDCMLLGIQTAQAVVNLSVSQRVIFT